MHEPHDCLSAGIPQESVGSRGRWRCPEFPECPRGDAQRRSEICRLVFNQLHNFPRGRLDELSQLSEQCGGGEWHSADEVSHARMEEGETVLSCGVCKGRERRNYSKS